MKTKSRNILKSISATVDYKLLKKLQVEFLKLGLEPIPKLNRTLIDFVQAKANFLAYKKFGSRRDLESRLSARMKTVSAVLVLAKNDREYFEDSLNKDYLNKQLTVAMIERAVLVDSKANKSDPRDTLVFGFHLWAYKQTLTDHNFSKSAEAITAILDSTGALSGVSARLNAATVKNRISKVEGLIKTAQGHGACHVPRRIGDFPKAESSIFVNALSGGCDQCAAAWLKTFRINKMTTSPFVNAAKKLSEEYPLASTHILSAVDDLQVMPLADLLEITPVKLRDVLRFVTQ